MDRLKLQIKAQIDALRSVLQTIEEEERKSHLKEQQRQLDQRRQALQQRQQRILAERNESPWCRRLNVVDRTSRPMPNYTSNGQTTSPQEELSSARKRTDSGREQSSPMVSGVSCKERGGVTSTQASSIEARQCWTLRPSPKITDSTLKQQGESLLTRSALRTATSAGSQGEPRNLQCGQQLPASTSSCLRARSQEPTQQQPHEQVR